MPTGGAAVLVSCGEGEIPLLARGELGAAPAACEDAAPAVLAGGGVAAAVLACGCGPALLSVCGGAAGLVSTCAGVGAALLAGDRAGSLVSAGGVAGALAGSVVVARHAPLCWSMQRSWGDSAAGESTRQR